MGAILVITQRYRRSWWFCVANWWKNSILTPVRSTALYYCGHGFKVRLVQCFIEGSSSWEAWSWISWNHNTHHFDIVFDIVFDGTWGQGSSWWLIAEQLPVEEKRFQMVILTSFLNKSQMLTCIDASSLLLEHSWTNIHEQRFRNPHPDALACSTLTVFNAFMQGSIKSFSYTCDGNIASSLTHLKHMVRVPKYLY